MCLISVETELLGLDVKKWQVEEEQGQVDSWLVCNMLSLVSQWKQNHGSRSW